MDTPLCQGQNCGVPLTRRQIQRKGRFCSKVCSGLESRSERHWNTAAATASRQALYAKRVTAEVLRELAALGYDPAVPMPLRDVVKVCARMRKIGYGRGWAAYYQRMRRTDHGQKPRRAA